MLTVTSSASRSQSAVMSTMRCTLPLVSPFRHSSFLDRDQKQVRPSRILISRLSRFMYASVRTFLVDASVTIAGIRPWPLNFNSSIFSIISSRIINAC